MTNPKTNSNASEKKATTVGKLFEDLQRTQYEIHCNHLATRLSGPITNSGKPFGRGGGGNPGTGTGIGCQYATIPEWQPEVMTGVVFEVKGVRDWMEPFIFNPKSIKHASVDGADDDFVRIDLRNGHCVVKPIGGLIELLGSLPASCPLAVYIHDKDNRDIVIGSPDLRVEYSASEMLVKIHTDANGVSTLSK